MGSKKKTVLRRIKGLLSIEKIFEYIDFRESGISTRKAAELSSISRTTGEKYYRKFKENRDEWVANPTSENSRMLIEECLTFPSYDTSTRHNRKYTDEVDVLLDQILEHEKEIADQLGNSHHQLTSMQIWRQIEESGFDIGLSTITKKVKEMGIKSAISFRKMNKSSIWTLNAREKGRFLRWRGS